MRSPVRKSAAWLSLFSLDAMRVSQRLTSSFVAAVIAVVFGCAVNLSDIARAAEQSKTDAAMVGRVQALIPDIESYIFSGMKGFDVPGLAIGIVANDRLVYAKGFGIRSKSNRMPVEQSFRSARPPRRFSP
jgi:CubicO group peptidase (beta-lactamase class C family)